MHIHVRKGEATAKFWIHPGVAVAEAYRMDTAGLRELAGVAAENRGLIERSWNEHFPE
jgi:hypothetical protein